MFKTSLAKLATHCKYNEYSGWDLFDGLNSKYFQATQLYKSRMLRLLWIQLFKRSFINLRLLTAVPKGYNAKGLGLFASGMLLQGQLSEAEELLENSRG